MDFQEFCYHKIRMCSEIKCKDCEFYNIAKKSPSDCATSMMMKKNSIIAQKIVERWVKENPQEEVAYEDT